MISHFMFRHVNVRKPLQIVCGAAKPRRFMLAISGAKSQNGVNDKIVCIIVEIVFA